ncbi:MAG: RNA-directed DNA polymerase [Rhodospirillaceae bacterium]|nr:RNA-directed DNA polymerase [Rhodospirillaceae bacterium]
MLDQSFSASNFRKIYDIENRLGNYLESDLFPEIEKQSRLIQVSKKNLRLLKKERELYLPKEYEERKEKLKIEIEDLENRKETMLKFELEKASIAVGMKNFSFGITKVDIGTPKQVFVAERNPATYFALKQVQHNIRRLYKVKQGNRHHIVCQLRELLGDKLPKYIIKTDISSFYESIPRRLILRKLNDDPLLTQTSKRIISRVLFEYGQKTGNETGLPRGIGISAYLAELYMRDIDRSIRNFPGVLYYARYVDDMFIIYCPPPNVGTSQFRRTVTAVLRDRGLTRNREKTKIITIDSDRNFMVEYLGYRFDIQGGSVVLRMTKKKKERYKRRIDLSIDDYNKQSRRSEKRARRLLEKRIRFLAGNTRLVNNKKNVVSGIYFSNSLLSDARDLKGLDAYLHNVINTIPSNRLKQRLLANSFEHSFQTRKYFKFTTQELSDIVEVWKNVT